MLDLTALLDRFGFLPLFEFLKSDKSLIPMWAAPAAERCFEYINEPGAQLSKTLSMNSELTMITIASWATILYVYFGRMQLS